MSQTARQFQKLEGGREVPAQSAMFSALLRVPMSALDVLQRTLYKGTYFEPRSGDGSSSHASFAVIWLPGLDLPAALHAHRTCPQSQALTRLGRKYGVRVKDTDEQTAFTLLKPSQEFVKVKVSMKYKLHPLPFGFQRHSVLQLLRRWKWSAKPLQPCKGDSQGSAWEVGSSTEPPALALPLGEGFVMLSLLRDVKQPRAPAALCASQRTKRSILHDDPEQASSAFDPWSNWQDPWAQAKLSGKVGVSSASSATSAASTRISQLEADSKQCVRDQVQQRMAETPETMSACPEQAQRIERLEVSMQELQLQNTKFEGWFSSLGKQVADTNASVAEVQHVVRNQQADLQRMQGDMAQQADLVQSSVLAAVGRMQQEVSNQLATQLSSQFSKSSHSLPRRHGLSD